MIFKLNVVIIFFIFSIKTFACELNAPVRHTNPDNSEGGLVGSQAKVASTAYIGYDAKVCDSAWVDGNAKVLDQAVVKGNAWVREFSTIKENALIDDNAVVWGNQGYPVTIGETAVVGGSIKVLAGTTVMGNARIIGEATIKSSTIGGNAKICGGFIVTNRTIYDDYFCTDSKLESRIEVSIDNYKEDSFNEISDVIEFKSRLYEFDPDSDVYVISVNGVQVDPESIVVNGNKVQVIGVTLKEGENRIAFSGRDEYQKVILDQHFKFMAGSRTKSIQLKMNDDSNPVKSKINAFIIHDDTKYNAIYDYEDGVLEIKGIPQKSVYDIGLTIEGVFTEGYLIKSFPNIYELPAEITVENFSSYVNNNTNLASLDDWSLSHPENVETLYENSGRKIKIRSDIAEPVRISKTFKLGKSVRGVHVKLKASSLNKNLNTSSKVQVDLVSSNHTFIGSQSFNSVDLMSSTNLASFYTDSNTEGFYSLVVTLFPGADEVLEILNIDLANAYIDFKPMHFFANNKENNPEIATVLESKDLCGEERFFLRDNNMYSISNNENMTFFSAAKATTLIDDTFNENRIFGSVVFDGLSPMHIADVELVVSQDGKELFRVGLSVCANERLESLKEFRVHNKSVLYGNDSLIHYLFKVNKELLSQIETLRFFDGVAFAHEVSLRVDVHLLKPSLNIISSPERKLPVLSMPDLDKKYRLSPLLTESYDSSVKGVLKTGGDKWINPVYQDVFEEMMKTVYRGKQSLKVNDISKLNGGNFPIHDTHKEGLDADMFLQSSAGGSFNLKDIKSDRDWQEYLDTLENYLKTTSKYNHLIDEYLISLNSEGLDTARDKLYSRFKNRCIGDRFISFTTKAGTGSLFRDAVGHSGHLHLSLRNPKSSRYNQKGYHLPQLDINKLEFYNDASEGTLIRPREQYASEFSDKLILWRFQDKRGFEDNDTLVAFGEWLPDILVEEIPPIELPGSASHFYKSNAIKSINASTVYGYIVLADIKTGSCSCYRVEMDTTAIKSSDFKDFNRRDCDN